MKKYLSKEELLEKVSKQGLIIEDKYLFFDCLEKFGYQKAVIYCRKPFGTIVNNEFAYNKDTKFEYLTKLYDFDFNLRLLTFKYISKIEEKIKSQLSEYVSKEFGTNYRNFIKLENFKHNTDKDLESFNKVSTSIENDITEIINEYEISISEDEVPRIKNDYIIDAYINEDNNIPFWCITTLLSLGEVSTIFSKMNASLCAKISSLYSLQPAIFASHIKRINLFRNVCAHQEKLYDFKTSTTARTKGLKTLYKSLGIKYNNSIFGYEEGVKDYLSLIIATKILLDDDEFHMYCDELLRQINFLETKIPQYAFEKVIKMMGLNNDWYNVLAYEKWVQK